jgi:hypothetical protein
MLRTALFWVITTTYCIITQKKAVLIYFTAEARNHDCGFFMA